MLYKDYVTRVNSYVEAVNAATPEKTKANVEGLLWLIREGRQLVLADVSDRMMKITDPITKRIGASIRRLQVMRGGDYAPCVI